MDTELTIALLIDSDNLSINYYDIIIGELEEIGQIRFKRVYGNFNDQNSWTKHAISKGITPIQAFAPVKGKNATDIMMAIDAMDIFYTGTVDAFCLATSDSDFTRLAQRLKEGGMYVIVAGKEQTPEALNNSCHKFIMLDQLYKIKKDEEKAREAKTRKDSDGRRQKVAKKPVEEKREADAPDTERVVAAPKLAEISAAVAAIIDEKSHDGWAYYSEVVSQLEKKFPQFNCKIYGVPSKQAFFKQKAGCETKTVGSAMMIKIKD